jgi:AmmeMemoRadiSam system protein A
MITKEHESILLRIARESIDGELAGRAAGVDVAAYDEPLQRPAGAFVTLKTDEGHLRGCIGSIVPVSPLCQAVATSALNAAFRDPRFHPLTPAEWPRIGIEISVMGPILRVTDLEEIVCGLDGLIVSLGHRFGLLLPQVAVEYAWDRETFLSHTCSKAGLPADSWRSPVVRIDRFRAHVFSE